MIRIAFAAVALLSVVTGGTPATCGSSPAAKTSVVCIVGTLKKEGSVRGVYVSDGAALIVEQTDAACIRETRGR